jgi:hypothetical protein
MPFFSFRVRGTRALVANAATGPIRRSSARLACCAIVAGCALASLALVTGACTPAATTPSIAAGERPVTGNARYDRFFAEVSELLASVEEAKREQADVRAALARRSGLSEDAALDALGARLRERTARLASEGLTLELDFTGIDGEAEDAASSDAATSPNEPAAEGAESSASKVIPTATLRTPGREPERRELRLLEVLAQAALSGATIYADMGRVERRVALLQEETSELRRALGSAFADASRRATVEAKLTEVEAFLPDLNRQAGAIENEADALIAVLDEAANTAPPTRRRTAREPSPAREVPARETPRDGAPESAARRAAPKTAEREPAAGSAERPKGDFEP